MFTLKMDEPAIYSIRVQGLLDGRYSDFLGGLSITYEIDENDRIVSVLTGRLLDQAALFGVLNQLNNMLLPLLRVEHQSE